jgi:hypothetical protein
MVGACIKEGNGFHASCANGNAVDNPQVRILPDP